MRKKNKLLAKVEPHTHTHRELRNQRNFTWRAQCITQHSGKVISKIDCGNQHWYFVLWELRITEAKRVSHCRSINSLSNREISSFLVLAYCFWNYSNISFNHLLFINLILYCNTKHLHIFGHGFINLLNFCSEIRS